MSESVKRNYDSRNREAQSHATKMRIVTAANALIIERGYRATTVAAIATAAEVNVDTIYQLIGRKSEVLRELIEQALSGVEKPVPAGDREYVAAIRAEPDPARKIVIYAAATRRMLARLAPLYVALKDAAGTDDSARELWGEFSERRAMNMRLFVGDLADAGGIRAGLAIEEAADTVWVTNSPEVYVMLTNERHWTPDRYEHWLAETWCRLLLP